MTTNIEELGTDCFRIEVASSPAAPAPALGHTLYMTPGVLHWITNASVSEERQRLGFLRECMESMASLVPGDEAMVFEQFEHDGTKTSVWIITDAPDREGIRHGTTVLFPDEF